MVRRKIASRNTTLFLASPRRFGRQTKIPSQRHTASRSSAAAAAAAAHRPLSCDSRTRRRQRTRRREPNASCTADAHLVARSTLLGCLIASETTPLPLLPFVGGSVKTSSVESSSLLYAARSLHSRSDATAHQTPAFVVEKSTPVVAAFVRVHSSTALTGIDCRSQSPRRLPSSSEAVCSSRDVPLPRSSSSSPPPTRRRTTQKERKSKRAHRFAERFEGRQVVTDCPSCAHAQNAIRYNFHRSSPPAWIIARRPLPPPSLASIRLRSCVDSPTVRQRTLATIWNAS